MGIPQITIILAALICIPLQDPVRQEPATPNEKKPATPFASEQWKKTIPLPHFKGLQPLRFVPGSLGGVPNLATANHAPFPSLVPGAITAPVPAMIAPPAQTAPVPTQWVPVAFPCPVGSLEIKVPVGQALPPKPAMPW